MDKKGRIVQVSPVAPPKNFNAGSIFQRTSSLMRPSMDGGLKMAFAKPQIKGKEIQIAAEFHAREDKKPDPGVPAMLAALVNNDHPDVLATAYAQSAPDYAKASPFEALLQDEDPNSGRFIPPMAKGDHSWIQNPLPASVFSKPEQKCLANGIYFEARSESVRGQAAVAQVILNRVRNPTYPNSICGVVYQNDSWFNRCQFSFRDLVALVQPCPGGRIVDPLLCPICPSWLGAHDAENDQDRPAYLLPHLWRRLELRVRRPVVFSIGHRPDQRAIAWGIRATRPYHRDGHDVAPL